MGVSMQFVIVSTRMFLTNRARQPSDSLAEQDILKTGVRKKKNTRRRRFVAKLIGARWRTDIQDQTISSANCSLGIQRQASYDNCCTNISRLQICNRKVNWNKARVREWNLGWCFWPVIFIIMFCLIRSRQSTLMFSGTISMLDAIFLWWVSSSFSFQYADCMKLLTCYNRIFT